MSREITEKLTTEIMDSLIFLQCLSIGVIKYTTLLRICMNVRIDE